MAQNSKTPEIRITGFEGNWKHKKFEDVFDILQNNTLSRSELNYDYGTVKNIHYGDVLIKFIRSLHGQDL